MYDQDSRAANCECERRNDITIAQQDPPNDEHHGAYAFYIGGSNQGGVYFRNRLTSNVPPVWIGNMYGASLLRSLFRSQP